METTEVQYNTNGTFRDPDDYLTWNWPGYDFPLACRNIRETDAQHLFPVMKRSAKMLKGYIGWAKYAPSWNFQTVSEFVKDHVNQGFPRFHLLFTIGKQVVGFGSLAPVNDNPKDVQIALWVGLGHQGRGIGKWIVKVMEFYAFNVFGCEHLYYQHDSSNRSSGKLPQALGFCFSHTFDDEIHAQKESGLWYSWVKDRPITSAQGLLDLGHSENWADVHFPWKCLI